MESAKKSMLVMRESYDKHNESIRESELGQSETREAADVHYTGQFSIDLQKER